MQTMVRAKDIVERDIGGGLCQLGITGINVAVLPELQDSLLRALQWSASDVAVAKQT